jgi:hypothetical protein
VPLPPVPGPEVKERSTFPVNGDLVPPTQPRLTLSALAERVLLPPPQAHVELESLPVKLKSMEPAKAAPARKSTATATVNGTNFFAYIVFFFLHFVVSRLFTSA